jgi:hypothetical protein
MERFKMGLYRTSYDFNSPWFEDLVLDHPIATLCVGLPLIILFIFFSLGFVHIDFGEDIYSGYIYSVEHVGDNTKIHLRFSETAGKDEQPEVCIDKKDDAKLDGLINTGKKVKITKPFGGFKIAPFWECAYPVEIEKIEEKNK